MRLSIGFLLLLLILLGRLFHLQVLDADDWERRSRDNRVRQERTKALRGLIWDRTGTMLATNRPSFSVAVLPYLVNERPDVRARLAELIDVPLARIDELLGQARRRPYQELRVQRDVDMRMVSRIEERRLELPGVVVISEPVREYPFGAAACHLLGYVGEISGEELSRKEFKKYRAGDEIGRNGIEKVCEDELRGTDGTRYILEDALGRRFEQLDEDPPEPGHSLVLTLDWPLQSVADSLLGNGGAGALVAMDPRDGAILALASAPAFDPNLFSGGISAGEWNRLNTDPAHPLINRALQATYSPGSTYKLVTTAAALEDRIISPGTVFRACFGGYQYGRRFFGCWEGSGHGQLALEQAIVHSCNTYFYQVGERLDLESFAAMGRSFGFGRRTGIDLPQEVAGLVPDGEYYDRRYGRSGWTQGHVLNLSIGQGELLATPLQLAVCYGAIATNGKIVTPRMLERVETWEGETLETIPPRWSTTELSSSTWRVLQDALAKVVESGTGGAARLRDVRVAGKTGTAQNPHGLEHAWFVGYAPVEAPELVVSVIVENAGHGGAIAAPIARRIFEQHFGVAVAMGGS